MSRLTRHIVEEIPFGNADSATVGLTFGMSAVEVPLIGSFGTEALTLTPVTTYEGLNADFATESVSLTPRGADIAAISDLATEGFKFTVSSVEAGHWELVETPTLPVVLMPSGTDIKGRQFTEAATQRITLTIETHECYQRPTPEYEIVVTKRWDMSNFHNRWTTDVHSRWEVDMLVGSLLIRC